MAQVVSVFAALMLLLAARLVQLQWLQHDEWRLAALESRTAATDIAYRRGRLLDRDGVVLAEDRTVYDLLWQYRDFRREHPAGQLLEALALLGSDAVSLSVCFEQAERLAAIWQATRPRHLAQLGPREREDLSFYLERLAGLRDSADLGAFDAWAAGGGDKTLLETFPQSAAHHQAALARARFDWRRLEEVLNFAPGELMYRLDEECVQIEAAVQRRVLRLAAARALELDSGGVLAALRGETELAAQPLLARLEERWHLPGQGPVLNRLLLEGEPAASLLPALQAIDQAAPADVEGLRRTERYDLHRSRQPVLRRALGFAAVDLLIQEADAFPGFEVRRNPRRAYPAGIAPHLVGGVSVPTAEQMRLQTRRQEEFHDLARIFDRSPEQEKRYRALREALPETALPADEPRGAFGAEAAFDRALRGSYGLLQLLQAVDAGGRNPRELEFRPAQDGADVRLGLEADLMAAAESAIVAAYAEVRREPAAQWPAEVVDALGRPRCGFVLLNLDDATLPVLATWPTFTADQYRTAYGALRDDPDRPLQHRALGGNYQGAQVPYPGSTFKPLIAVAALRKDAAAWRHQYECTGSYLPRRASPGARPLDCDEQRVHGKIGMEEALVRSCNVYFYRLAEDLELEPLLELSKELGFGAPTGIEIGPGASGIVPGNGWNLEFRANLLQGPESARDSFSVLRLGIGQVGVTASPLQMARFYGWLATGELLVPRLALAGPKEIVPAAEIPESLRALISGALRRVVEDPSGTAHDSRWPLEKYRVAGKTGTAQVGQGAPVHAWFTGWFPHERPRYAFAVYCENAGVHGGDLAAVILYRFLEATWAGLLPSEP
jgi:cell division protein FtsI/penicillin-binding protein 2